MLERREQILHTCRHLSGDCTEKFDPRKDAGVARVSSGHLLKVGLPEGRVLGLQFFLFPAHLEMTESERDVVRVIDKARGIRWPRLDLVVFTAGLLSGGPVFSACAAQADKQANGKSCFRLLAAGLNRRAG